MLADKELKWTVSAYGSKSGGRWKLILKEEVDYNPPSKTDMVRALFRNGR